MEEGHVHLAWLNPSIPVSWPGRVLRTPAGPLTSRLPPDTSGVRRHLSVDLEAHFLVVPDLAVVPTLPAPLVLAAFSLRWRCPGVGDAAECEDYLACQHADHLPPRSPRTRERRRGMPKAPWTAATVRERLPGQAEPRRAIIRPYAPYDPRRRTRSFPVGRSPSPVVGDHALSSELSFITLYRTHRIQGISTLTDNVAEPIHLISTAAN
jgi:hypothetical protein